MPLHAAARASTGATFRTCSANPRAGPVREGLLDLRPLALNRAMDEPSLFL
jgi:hypothetical protein